MFHRNLRIPVAPAVLALAVLGSAACSSTDPSSVTRELLTMSKEEAYARGEALVAKRKYEVGRQYLRFVAENYANDALGKQAALRLADSFFEEKSPLGYVEAQGRFKDFRSRYPSHPRSDYALFRLAQVSDRQAEKPDRDQANTRLAAQSYRELLQNYPGSPYTAEARARYRSMLDLLAEHEFLVAQYYFKRSAWEASRKPLRGALRRVSRVLPDGEGPLLGRPHGAPARPGRGRPGPLRAPPPGLPGEPLPPEASEARGAPRQPPRRRRRFEKRRPCGNLALKVRKNRAEAVGRGRTAASSRRSEP